MLGRLTSAVAVALAVSAGAASAGSVYATSVSGVLDGGGIATKTSTACKTTNRSDICNALGAPDGGRDGGFVSSGNFMKLSFEFGAPFTGPLKIFEVSWGTPQSYEEVLGLTFILSDETSAGFGTVVNVEGDRDTNDRWVVVFDDFGGVTGPFARLDVMDMSGTSDGFDIDAIEAQISVVPLPAAGLLLLGALGGLAAVRRRRG